MASFLSVRASVYPFRIMDADPDGRVRALVPPSEADLWINGGYMTLRGDIFDHMRPGDELVEAPFQRLAAAGLLHTTRYEGFWAPMDTLRDVERLEELVRDGRAPWTMPAVRPDRIREWTTR